MKRILCVSLLLLGVCGFTLFALDTTSSMPIYGYFYGSTGTTALTIYNTSTTLAVVQNEDVAIPAMATSSLSHTFDWTLTGTVKGKVTLTFQFAPLSCIPSNPSSSTKCPVIPMTVQLYASKTHMGSAILGTSAATIDNKTYTETITPTDGVVDAFTVASGSTSIKYSNLSGKSKSGTVTYSLSTSNTAATVPQWSRTGQGYVSIDLSSQSSTGTYSSTVTVTVTVG